MYGAKLWSSNRQQSSATPTVMQEAGAAELRMADPEREALRHEDYFGVKSLVSLTDLFTAKVHLSHKSGTRNVYMTPYIFGSRLDVDILDLDQTLSLLHDALNFTAHVAYRGGIVLFLTRHAQTLPLVEKTAEECGEYSHCRLWKGGTFTNSTIQFGSEIRLPDLCVFLHSLQGITTHVGLVEATKMQIPTVAVVDTNCDPRLVTYPVPGNDDSPVAVGLYCRLLKQAVLKGKERRKEDGLTNPSES